MSDFTKRVIIAMVYTVTVTALYGLVVGLEPGEIFHRAYFLVAGQIVFWGANRECFSSFKS